MSSTMLGNLFSNRVVPVPATRPDSSASPSFSEPGKPRYPKRKRASVQYTFDDADETESESELEFLPVKRARNTRPLPRNKVFPFMSLPAELRNRIYEECLPPPTKMPAKYDGNKDAIWLCYKQRFYRRSIGYIPSLEDNDIEAIQYGGGYLSRPRMPTGRGRPQGHVEDNNDSDSDAEEPETGPEKLGFNILSVCKQIYDEAAPMMYAKTLVFTDVDAVIAFASTLSPRTAKLIRSIEIRSWCNTRSRKSRGYNAIAMLAAKGVTNLLSLYINCSMGWFHSYSWRNNRRETPLPKRIARKVYRDCHLWLEVMASAHGDVYKGIEVLKLNGEMFDRRTDWDDVEEGDKAMYKKELRRLLRESAW